MQRMLATGRGKAAAVAGVFTATTAGFVYWDATDKRGGVGITRATTATATAALIVADYKLSLRGMVKDSPPFVAARHLVGLYSAVECSCPIA